MTSPSSVEANLDELVRMGIVDRDTADDALAEMESPPEIYGLLADGLNRVWSVLNPLVERVLDLERGQGS